MKLPLCKDCEHFKECVKMCPFELADETEVAVRGTHFCLMSWKIADKLFLNLTKN